MRGAERANIEHFTWANFGELIRNMVKALKVSTSEWTAVASDEGSEGKKSSMRRGAVGLAIGKSDGTGEWTGGALLTGADQTAMAAEVFAATVAIQAVPRSRKKIQPPVDNWEVCSQLRRTFREEGAMPRNPRPLRGSGGSRVLLRRRACSRSAGARHTGKGQSGAVSLQPPRKWQEVSTTWQTLQQERL